jgi:hypothetical protein
VLPQSCRSFVERADLAHGTGVSDNRLWQTYNSEYYGPTFGGGHDLHVENNLGSGYAFNFSFGGTSWGDDITTGDPNGGRSHGFHISELEVFAFAQASNGGGTSVPDASSTVALLGLCLLGLAGVRRLKGTAA